MNIELEPTIISSLIEYPQLVDDFTRIIKPYHVSKDYQNIYATLIKLKNNNEVIEPAKILLNLSFNTLKVF
ncbi:Uncharacterised protein [Campylobacter hyointestinalis subsp. hyointestinalis]|uniref:DNA helicase DnaB-like N-terminal domain-containing protein n=1 Tax=Campylobacter hyointestinalis subsp. hyointestinalis TaxID=91352 RepID=A0A9W5APH5_CAMHY|nr:DnaB-like helicase N-terminal domain-containing protein [Campylobacter hyointestinalis]CUU75228.1 Uncharacterised protein [Campylobacter hyointestinalis subsp. hyointestinalis]